MESAQEHTSLIPSEPFELEDSSIYSEILNQYRQLLNELSWKFPNLQQYYKKVYDDICQRASFNNNYVSDTWMDSIENFKQESIFEFNEENVHTFFENYPTEGFLSETRLKENYHLLTNNDLKNLWYIFESINQFVLLTHNLPNTLITSIQKLSKKMIDEDQISFNKDGSIADYLKSFQYIKNYIETDTCIQTEIKKLKDEGKLSEEDVNAKLANGGAAQDFFANMMKKMSFALD